MGKRPALVLHLAAQVALRNKRHLVPATEVAVVAGAVTDRLMDNHFHTLEVLEEDPVEDRLVVHYSSPPRQSFLGDRNYSLLDGQRKAAAIF